jgi:amidase
MKDYTVCELIQKINTKALSIHEISDYYLNRIKTYDGYLNSISEINPDLSHIIETLEKSPQKSKLHGIPIVIKDNIQTKDQMHTTANSYALKDFIAPFDATIVKKLRDSGMVLLGKSNLSEFAYFMSDQDMPSGYGSLHGQVIHPYNPKIDPLGSSTGSAVSVAADLIPISIGTETNGSLMAPAYKNSITSIKPSLGFVSRYGIIPVSQFQDTPGPMAKTVEDCALLLDVIYGYDPQDPATKICKSYKPSFYEATKKTIKNKKIAILNYSYKDFKYSKEEQEVLDKTKNLFISLGAEVIELDFILDNLNNEETLLIEFKNDINAYFKSVRPSCPIESLEDLIAFNKKHAKRCLVFGQSIFEAAQKTSGNLDDDHYKAIKSEQMKKAKKLENLLKLHHLDAAISPMRNSYAPIYGSPTISVPAKALNDLNPLSLVFFGKMYDDENLITIAHQFEIHTHYRIPPKLKG